MKLNPEKLLPAVSPLVLLILQLILKAAHPEDASFYASSIFIVFFIVWRLVLHFIIHKDRPEKKWKSTFTYTGSIFICAAICFLYSFAVIGIAESHGADQSTLDVIEQPAVSIINGADNRYLLNFLLITPVAEELAFRSMQKDLRSQLGRWISLVISILAYAFYMLCLSGKSGLIFGFASGAALAILFEIYDNYAASAAGNFGCSAGILLAYIGVLLTKESLNILANIALILSITLIVLAWLGEHQAQKNHEKQLMEEQNS